MGKGGENKQPPPVPGLTRPVRSVRSARRYLSRLLTAYQAGLIDSVNAKTSVYILSEYIRATEGAELEPKVEALAKEVLRVTAEMERNRQ